MGEYIQRGSQNVQKKDLEKVIKKEDEVRTYLSKIEKNVKEELEILFELVRDYYKGEYKSIPWRSVALAVFAFLYLINPLDILPDIAGPLGLADDLAIFGCVLASLAEDLRRYKKWREEREKKTRA